MRVYVDSSALIKRSLQEAESDAVEEAFDRYVGQDAVIISSSLAWIEVSRALRSRLDGGPYSEDEILDAVEGALSGVAERVITEDVIGLARRVAPPQLRSLDAIHLATAILLDVDEVVAYDDRLIDACRHNGLVTVAPGRRPRSGGRRSGSTVTDVTSVFDRLGVSGAAYAVPVTGGSGQGVHADDLMTPASVMKVQVALAVENAIAAGAIDGQTRRTLRSQSRTPGPVGLSLMQDEVSMSVRDLVVAMLTVSDNVATDELIAAVGLDQINDTTRQLGMTRTKVTNDLQDMLDDIARDAGFDDYRRLISHDPAVAGPPSERDLRHRIAASAALDPNRGSRTTARETVTLLQTIWTDRAGTPEACAAVRRTMGHQLTRHRIASGFDVPVTVAAKSGGLMGIVRNEAGVVTFPDGSAYAVAVFTRSGPDARNAAEIDASIGAIARLLIDQLRTQPTDD